MTEAIGFPAFPATKRKPGRFARSWWGNAWLQAMEDTSLDTGQLKRGRRYAYAGLVGPITVSPGRIAAQVDGEDGAIHHTAVFVDRLTAEEWHRFLDEVAAKAGHIAALLDRDMPQELVAAATDADVRLLPGIGDLQPECDCPGWDHPCRHAAALCFQASWLLDADPFVLLLMRGLGQRDLTEELRRRSARRQTQATASSTTASPTGSPTTASPTTNRPTVGQTTASPTTGATTDRSTTGNLTTASSTTASSTTAGPTTAGSTTSPTTGPTGSPTTGGPTTNRPTVGPTTASRTAAGDRTAASATTSETTQQPLPEPPSWPSTGPGSPYGTNDRAFLAHTEPPRELVVPPAPGIEPAVLAGVVARASARAQELLTAYQSGAESELTAAVARLLHN